MGFNWIWGTDDIRDAVLGTKDYKEVANRFGSLEPKLTDFFSNQINQSGPTFPGGSNAAVAPLTGYENKSFDFLNQYGSQNFGANPSVQNAKSAVNQILSNKFDPTSDPYYQAVKAASSRNLNDTKREIKNNQSGGGRFYTGATTSKLADADIESGLNLDLVLGQLFNQRENQRLQAAPVALNIANQEAQFPLSQAAAYQSLGGLPRQVDQAKRDFDVNQFQQSQIDYPISIAQMLSGLLNANQPVLEAPKPGLLQQFTQGIGQALPYLLMAAA